MQTQRGMSAGATLFDIAQILHSTAYQALLLQTSVCHKHFRAHLDLYQLPVTVVSVEPIGMLRLNCSGETRLGLGVPSSS